MDGGDVFAGSASAEKQQDLSLTNTNSEPKEYGKGLKQEVPAGSASSGKELTNGETSLKVAELEYEEHSLINTNSVRELQNKTTIAGNARELPSETSIKLMDFEYEERGQTNAGNTRAVLDSEMIAGSASEVQNKERPTLSYLEMLNKNVVAGNVSGATTKQRLKMDKDFEGLALMDKYEGSAIVDKRRTGSLTIEDKNMTQYADNAGVEYETKGIPRIGDDKTRMNTGSASG